ncbi:MAG: hypothetical protein AB1791_17140 [Chloroflexota bacterium]
MVIRFFFLITLILGLAACNGDEQVSPSPAATTTLVATRPPATATPTPRPPTPTPIATPTPIPPAITVVDQTLGDDGRLTIASVTIPAAGWLVLYTDQEGQMGEVVGYAAVQPGVNQDVVVTIDPLQATPTLHAALHTDAGSLHTFEFPGPDNPLPLASGEHSLPFTVEIQVTLPAVVAADQVLGLDGLLRVESAVSPGPGWLAVHADSDGEVGPLLAYLPLRDGLNENLVLALDWRKATPRLYAVLHHDEGESGRFEPATGDPIVLASGVPVISPLTAVLPPDIVVYDQPVVNGAVEVERAVSNGPGWLTIQGDDNGAPGLIIGFAPLEDGINEQITVPVVENGVTPVLYAALHQDTGTAAEFEFPRADPLVLLEGGRPVQTTFSTEGQNYLFTQDQTLTTSNTVTVPLVIVNVNVWAVIRADQGGEPGEVLGQTWLAAGIHHDVAIEIDPAGATEVLYAELFLDAGARQQFDSPDVPLLQGDDPLRAPFILRGLGD